MKDSSEPSTLPPTLEGPADPRLDPAPQEAAGAAAPGEPAPTGWSPEPTVAREADNWEG